MAVLKFNFLSKELGLQTNVTVVIPSFSFADIMSGRKDVYVPGMKFQTLYLLHGGSGDDSDYVNFSNIVRYADQHKLAVVMPSAANSFYSNLAYGPRYWNYISRELPTACRAMFPLSDKREDTFVAGLSMGGAGTMKFALKCPEMFAAALVMSGASIKPENIDAFVNRMGRNNDPEGPPMPKLREIYGDLSGFRGSEEDMYAQALKNVQEGKPLPKFFFACGDKDFALDGVVQAKDFLKEAGYDVVYEETPGYGHEWDFWDLTLRRAIAEWLPIRHAAIYPEEM